MKKQTVKIGDEFFTIERPIERVDCLDYGYDLYQCYDRPSERKKGIFEDWKKWAYENGVKGFGIATYNDHMFTLRGNITIDGVEGLIWITKTRQEFYPFIN